MKNRLSQARLLAVVGAFSIVLGSRAQEPNFPVATPSTNAAVIAATTVEAIPAPTPPAPASTPAPATSISAVTPPAAPVKLPYGVEDVVKLTRAQVGEEVVLTYIQNSGTIYNLGANDIVNLRNEGVSDKVINSMLDQRKRAAEAAAQAAQTAAAAAQPYTYSDPSLVTAAPAYTQTPYPQAEQSFVQPATDVVEAAPSTVYVIPFQGSSLAYYGRAGYYRSYPYCGSYYRGYGGHAYRAYRGRWR